MSKVVQKLSRPARLFAEFKAVEAEYNAAADKLSDIEERNELDLTRAPQVMVGRFHEPNGKHRPIYAYSHEEIDERRNPFLGGSGSITEAQQEKVKARTRALHQLFDLDAENQRIMHDHIGLTAAKAAVADAVARERAIVAKLVALRPKTKEELRDKVAICHLLDDDEVPFDGELTALIAADVARLFPSPIKFALEKEHAK